MSWWVGRPFGVMCPVCCVSAPTDHLFNTWEFIVSTLHHCRQDCSPHTVLQLSGIFCGFGGFCKFSGISSAIASAFWSKLVQKHSLSGLGMPRGLPNAASNVHTNVFRIHGGTLWVRLTAIVPVPISAAWLSLTEFGPTSAKSANPQATQYPRPPKYDAA